MWLPAFQTDRLSRSQRKWRVKPFATVAASAGGLRIAAMNAHAADGGVHPGMPLADARALLPVLDVVAADPAGDAETLTKLAAWCGSFSPWTAPDSAGAAEGAGIWLDATGCAHLFGGELQMLQELLDRLSRMGFVARAALADSAGAAWAAVRFAPGAQAIVIRAGGTRAALADLPTAGLRLAPAVIEGLSTLGLRRIGDLYDVARAPLVTRFGKQLAERLDRALGVANEPLSPLLHEIPYRERLGLAEPIGTRPDIDAALMHLLERLCVRLGREHRGARRLEFALFRVDGSVARVHIGTSRSVRDPRHLQRLFAEHLDSLDLGEGVEVLTLAAPVVEELSTAQLDMAAQAAAVATANVADLVDRLTNRLGEDAVLRVVEKPSHIPEHAGVALPAAQNAQTETVEPPPGRGERPLRLFPNPLPVEAVARVPDGPPALFRWRRVVHRIIRAEGPERIAPEWWRTSLPWTTAWEETTRDYYRVEDDKGRRFWLYREGLYPLNGGAGTHAPRWFMHGLFA